MGVLGKWRGVCAVLMVLGLMACSTVFSEVATLTAEQVVRENNIEAAKAGDPEAQYVVAMTYCCTGGLPSTTYDNVKTTEWLCRAADQGYGKAMAQLGELYSGDLVDGVKLFRRAYTLIGAEDERPVIAALWLHEAVAAGYTDAQSTLDDVLEDMNEQQLQELADQRVLINNIQDAREAAEKSKGRLGFFDVILGEAIRRIAPSEPVALKQSDIVALRQDDGARVLPCVWNEVYEENYILARAREVKATLAANAARRAGLNAQQASLHFSGAAGAGAPGAAAAGAKTPLVKPISSSFTPDAQLKLCPKIKISNAPAAGADRVISGYNPIVVARNKVPLASAPLNGACFSSGFGPRGSKIHRGVDYHAKSNIAIYAAGAGEIVEAGYRDDYGNMVLIDHGDKVFTRYAHLSSIGQGVMPGVKVPFGAQLGAMGRTGKYRVAQHLHYEVLTGNYATPKKSFGLIPLDPMSLPAFK